jgi:D-alanine-D-alanine ligase
MRAGPAGGKSAQPYVVLCDFDDNIRGGEPLDAVAALSQRETAAAVVAALGQLGPVALVETGSADPERLCRALASHDPLLVFNLAEGARGRADLEACVAALIQLLGIPFTGNSAVTLALCLDKPKTMALLRGVGVAVPDGVVLRDPWHDRLDGVRYPAIVKPACLDASHGIEPENVVGDERAARAKAAALIARFPPLALVEAFVDGREIAASMIQAEPDAAPVLLPLSEINWQLPPGLPRVLGFEAKWIETSERYAQTPVTLPATVTAGLRENIEDVCRTTFEAVSARDYLRIDLRIDRDDRVFVVDVNPNPCISPTAGFACSAAAAGWSYRELIHRLARNAEIRGSRDLQA